MDCVLTAPTPDFMKGQVAPTARLQVVTATAKAPVAGSCATMDQVMGWAFLEISGETLTAPQRLQEAHPMPK
jgi:hypothetical protein